jgi:hypothetical protein
MIIEFNNGLFYLNSQDEELGTLHAQMIEDFKDSSKLERFKQLLESDSNTAFSIFVTENNLK